MPNQGDAHTAAPSNKSMVTEKGGIDTSGMPPIDESGLPASRLIGHEQYEVGLRGVFQAMVWFVIVLIITFVAVYFTMFGFQKAELASEQAKTGVKNAAIPLPPEPRLQPSRGHEILEWDERNQVMGGWDKRLHQYGWIDEKAQTVHIPIDEAMKIALQDPKVLPARAGGQRPAR